MSLDEYNAKIIVQLQAELAQLKAHVAKMDAFLTDYGAVWPMTSDQKHTSKTDDKAALAKLIADA